MYAHPDFAFHLGSRLREQDKFELLFNSPEGSDPAVLLGEAMDERLQSFGVVDDGILRALWGFEEWADHPELPTAFIWLMSDDVLFTKFAVEMTRRFKTEILPSLLEMYGSVGNFIMKSNQTHVRWLKACGLREVTDATHDGQEFVLMRIDQDV